MTDQTPTCGVLGTSTPPTSWTDMGRLYPSTTDTVVWWCVQLHCGSINQSIHQPVHPSNAPTHPLYHNNAQS